jgi:hypothetical protein
MTVLPERDKIVWVVFVNVVVTSDVVDFEFHWPADTLAGTATELALVAVPDEDVLPRVGVDSLMATVGTE